MAAYGREAALAICEYGQREPEAGGSLPRQRQCESGEAAPQMDDGSRLVAEIAAAAMPIVDGARGARCGIAAPLRGERR